MGNRMRYGDARVRAAKTDEALEVITALWSGKTVDHDGPHYRVDGVTLAPVPVQRPRVPIWIGGDSPAAYRRAARWDGWIAAGDNEQGEMVMPAEKIASLAGRFDIALTGASSGPDDPVLADYERAGVTWWLEHLHERSGAQADLIARIEAGPVTSRP